MIDLSTVIFFLFRHGRTNSNEKNIYRAWSNAKDAQLNDDGRRDAQEAGEYFSSIKAPISVLLSDSLDRTLETTEIIASVLGAEQITALRQLHPLNVGEWTGKSKDDHPPEELWNDKTFRPPGGESLNEFDTRQMAAFREVFGIADAVEPGTLAISGHGSTVCFLHNRVFNKDDTPIGYEGLVDPGGVIAVTSDGLVPLTKIREKKGSVKRDTRMTAKEAGYMELPGAVKDNDCHKVRVEGGVAGVLGCCNEFRLRAGASEVFSCGTCRFVSEIR